MTRRAAVTGASGYIGSALVRELLVRGWAVTAIVRRIPEDKLDGVTYVSADLSDSLRLRGLDLDVDVVFHAAALAHRSSRDVPDPELYSIVNRDATLALAAAADGWNASRFVFISSIGVHGDTDGGRPITENSPLAPTTPYGRSKLEAEKGLLAHFAGDPQRLVIVRPPLVYSAEAPGNFRKLLRLVASPVPLPLPFGAVHNRRSLVALKNLCDFLIACAESPAAGGRQFVVSDDLILATPDIIRLISEGMGKRALLLPIPESFMRFVVAPLGPRLAFQLFGSLEVDSALARRTLDWKQPLDTQDALREAGRGYLAKRRD